MKHSACQLRFANGLCLIARRNEGRNESCELLHRPTFTVMPLPELAALGPAYGAWPHRLLKYVTLSFR